MAFTARHAASGEVLLLIGLALSGDGQRGRARRASALRIGLALPLVIAAVGLLRGAVERSRPVARVAELRPLAGHGRGRSFPSRHTACAVAMAIVASRGSPLVARLMGGLAVALAVSRVYVGLHFPTDVVAGAALGCVVGFAARRANLPIPGRARG